MTKFCECGCGQIVKNRFAWGHIFKTNITRHVFSKNNIQSNNRRGCYNTLSHNEKIGKANSNKKHTETDILHNRISKLMNNRNITKKEALDIINKQKIKKYCMCGCGEEVSYNHNYILGHHMKEKFGNKNNYWKKKHNIASLIKMRKPRSLEGKENIRMATLRIIQEHIKNGMPITPMSGRHEKQILDHMEQMLNVKIQRQYFCGGYWLDGYCPERNLVIEVDEGHHYDESGKLKQRDIERQNYIQQKLKCNFIRIDEKFVDLINRTGGKIKWDFL